MKPSKDPSKLRMAPPESPDEIARRLGREQTTTNREREFELEGSLAPLRVGSVRALNAVPLTRGLEEDIVLAPPSRLAELLQANKLDAALVSVVEVLLNDRYDVLDEIAIACLGEVRSVILAHRQPLEEIHEIYCDTASLTSVRLLRVLLAERGLNPEFKPLADYNFEVAPANLMLIGDPALDFVLAPHEHQVWDLGAAWNELTGLPFVFAVWALRRDVDTKALRRQLREARDFGLDTLDEIIRTRSEYTYDFRKDYLTWHIHYHLGTDEKRGLRKFIELLRKHGIGPVYEPKFVT